MLIEQTKQQLQSLKLSGFLDVLAEIQQNPSGQTLSIDEMLGLMVEREITLRQNKKQARLLKSAKLRYPTASMESIDYIASRQFNQQQLRSLASLQWISQGHNLVLLGPTGIGKSFIACALGQKACRHQYTVRYFRLTRLLEDLRIALADGSYANVMTMLAKTQLLILDDWGIDKLDRNARKNLLEILGVFPAAMRRNSLNNLICRAEISIY